MKKTLILETSAEVGLIALKDDGATIAHLPLTGGAELSRTLALHLQHLLKTHSFQPELIAVGMGPGSYTGVRVGMSLAKALAFGWEIPVLGFCSLKAFMAPGAAAVVVDARMGGFYVLRECKAALLSPEEAFRELKGASLLASPHPDLIRKRLDLSATFIETRPNPDLIIKEEFETLKIFYP